MPCMSAKNMHAKSVQAVGFHAREKRPVHGIGKVLNAYDLFQRMHARGLARLARGQKRR